MMTEEIVEYDPVPSWDCYYGKALFWDERYLTNCEHFEWYASYETLKPLVRKVCALNDKIMIAGCGSSSMAYDMYNDGFRSLTNVDISRVLISEMMERYANISVRASAAAALGTKLPDFYRGEDLAQGVRWLQADCTNLKINFDDKCFDLVFDKALLDSISASEIPSRSIKKYLNEVERILTPTGTFICVSHGLPEYRLDILEDTDPESSDFFSWGQCKVLTIPKPTVDPFAVPDALNLQEHYFVYICTKTPDADAIKDRILREEAEAKANKNKPQQDQHKKRRRTNTNKRT